MTIKNPRPELCGECRYLVDWTDFPDSTGYSMYTQGENRYGCMYYIARFNQLNPPDCTAQEYDSQIALKLEV